MLSQDYIQGKLNCSVNQIFETVWQIDVKNSWENGIRLSEASKLNRRTLIATFSYSGIMNLIKKKIKKWYALNLEYLGGYILLQSASVISRPALLPLILMEVDSCQNCVYGLHNIKCEEASVNKSEALAGQSRSFLLSDYINDVDIAFI